jgi:transcriptional regulator with XRE-family HTH domain
MGPDGRDLGKGAVSSWEVDRAQPSAAQLALIALRLGVSADFLLGLTSPKSEPWDGVERRSQT